MFFILFKRDFLKKSQQKKHHCSGGGLLSQGKNPSTIGAERLDFCVRDGNRYNPLARTTRTMVFFLFVFRIKPKMWENQMVY